MDEANEDLNQAIDANDDEVQPEQMGLGNDPASYGDEEDAETKESLARADDPMGVKKRLGMQAKRHQREMRQLREQIEQLHTQLGAGGNNRLPNFAPNQVDTFNSPGQPNSPSGSEEERIQRAVRYALDAKDADSRRQQEAQKVAHVQKQYQNLMEQFDNASEKYEDFDDVVRGNDVPFSAHVRDALLLVPNPAEVAYKLGKNRSELQRISQLHPIDQAREVNKLSFALMGGNNTKSSSVPRANSLNPSKPNPGTSSAVTDKTPASVIRERMKSGMWK